MSKRRVFQPGDLIKLDFDFDPILGHEQGGFRRALVVSEAAYNARVGLALVCPTTTQVKGYPFEVPIPDGYQVHGVVLADQVKCVDLKARAAKYVETGPAELLHTVRGYIALLIGAK